MMFGLTRQQIIERLMEVQFSVTTPAANIFAANVPATHRRYILDIAVRNNSANQLSARFRRVLVDGTFRNFYPNVPVSGFEIVHLNDSADKIGSPLAVLTRGQNIDALRGEATNLDATVTFFDIPRN